jgi:hypothetical protein
MDITIKVIKILDSVSGVSQRTGNAWEKHSFVGETEGNYPRKVCFSVMGKDRWDKFAIRVDMKYNVSFDVESREWQGKWFTELSAWNVVCIGDGAQQPAQQEPAPSQEQDPNDPPF